MWCGHGGLPLHCFAYLISNSPAFQRLRSSFFTWLFALGTFIYSPTYLCSYLSGSFLGNMQLPQCHPGRVERKRQQLCDLFSVRTHLEVMHTVLILILCVLCTCILWGTKWRIIMIERCKLNQMWVEMMVNRKGWMDKTCREKFRRRVALTLLIRQKVLFGFWLESKRFIKLQKEKKKNK
jgi:hypothetical protein